MRYLTRENDVYCWWEGSQPPILTCDGKFTGHQNVKYISIATADDPDRVPLDKGECVEIPQTKERDSMEQSFQDMGQRYENAANSFIECIQGIVECTKAEAEKVLKIYQKEKLVKLGWNDGQFHMRHGGFMDAAVIRRAIEL